MPKKHDRNHKLATLNRAIKEVLPSISPLKQIKLRSKTSIKKKALQIGQGAVSLVVGEEKASLICCDSDQRLNTLLLKVAEGFRAAKLYREKVWWLTIPAAAGLSITEIEEKFETTKYLAKAAIDQQSEKGLLVMPPQRNSNQFSPETKQLIISFYLHDDVSKMLPGKKDFVIIRSEGQKEHVQKRLLLLTLSHAFTILKEKYPDIKVGFAKFTRLRPPQVVFPGSPGTAITCVCMIHGNAELLFEAISKIDKLAFKYANMRDCVFEIMCKEAKDECHLGECKKCPDSSKLTQYLLDYLSETETISCRQWVNNKGCRLVSMALEANEFVEMFVESLQALRPHRFLCIVQRDYFDNTKYGLQPGVVLVLGDYSENYSFFIQRAPQGIHWVNDQATLHVFVCLFLGRKGELCEFNFVSVSNYTTHETRAVHLFQTRMMPELRKAVPFPLKKIEYFTDGSSAQYKNRFNFKNLMHHEEDFGVSAIWHFHPTSHGKNLCDGVGGTVKRCAYRASLQKDAEPIDNPYKLHNYVKTLPKIHSDYTSIDDHKRHNIIMDERFLNCPAVAGCRSMHSFQVKQDGILSAKKFSSSSKEYLYKI
jgi:hypothetical protein